MHRVGKPSHGVPGVQTPKPRAATPDVAAPAPPTLPRDVAPAPLEAHAKAHVAEVDWQHPPPSLAKRQLATLEFLKANWHQLASRDGRLYPGNVQKGLAGKEGQGALLGSFDVLGQAHHEAAHGRLEAYTQSLSLSRKDLDALIHHVKGGKTIADAAKAIAHHAGTSTHGLKAEVRLRQDRLRAKLPGVYELTGARSTYRDGPRGLVVGNLGEHDKFQILQVTPGGYAQVYVPRTKQYGYMELRSGKRLNVKLAPKSAQKHVLPPLSADKVRHMAGYSNYITAPMKKAGATYTEHVALVQPASAQHPLRVWGNVRGGHASHLLARKVKGGDVSVRTLTHDRKFALVRVQAGGSTNWGFVPVGALDPASLAQAQKHVRQTIKAFKH